MGSCVLPKRTHSSDILARLLREFIKHLFLDTKKNSCVISLPFAAAAAFESERQQSQRKFDFFPLIYYDEVLSF